LGVVVVEAWGMRVMKGYYLAAVVVTLCGCGGEDGGGGGAAGSAGSASGAGGVGSGGSAGSGGAQGGGAALVSKGAISLELSESTCVSQTSWTFPDPTGPVTATSKGTFAVDQGPFRENRVRCLVQRTSAGRWDIAAGVSLNSGESALGVNAFVDPAVPSEGGFQLFDPLVREDISSNKAGPCLFTLIEVSEGKVWGKVDCATTHERDMTECGAAVIYYAFEDCYTDRRQFNDAD
jgi:hypothetical protein